MPWSKNPVTRKAAKARYKAKYPEKWKADRKRHDRNRFLNRMGIDTKTFQLLCKWQQGRCGLCGQVPANTQHAKLLPDHNHKTGKFRGVICGQCNRGLGLLGDTLEQIRLALAYLEHGESLWR